MLKRSGKSRALERAPVERIFPSGSGKGDQTMAAGTNLCQIPRRKMKITPRRVCRGLPDRSARIPRESRTLFTSGSLLW